MTVYVVTTSNWNDAAFWNAINEVSAGHTLDFSALPSNFSVNFWPDVNQISLSDGTTGFSIGDSDDVNPNDAQMAGTTQLEFFTTVISTQGDDTVEGDDNNDTVVGGNGEDLLFGNGGADSISGGAGNDTLHGNIGNDTLEGGTGADTIYGGTGNDTIDGGDGADVVIVQDNFGNDTIQGGNDQDTIDFDALTSGITGVNTVGAGTDIVVGSDTLNFSGFENFILTGQADSLDMTFEVPVTISGGAGNDTLVGSDFGGAGDSLVGGADSDVLDGNNGDDTLEGGTGNDTLLAGFGSDVFDGGDDIDTVLIDGSAVGGIAFSINLDAGTDIFGNTYTSIENVISGSADDTIIGTSGSNLIDGGAGNDSLLDGEGVDTIYGGAGDDTIGGLDSGSADEFHGGSGSDSIYVGNGQDTAYGDDGADFIFSEGSGDGKTVFGGEGGVDDDTLSWSTETDAGDAVNVTFTSNEAGSAIIRGQTVTFSEIENIEGTQAADTFDASATTTGVNVDGLDGNDTLTGGAGNDTLLGGDGTDTIDGGSGADSIIGGRGSDFIEGGAGNDTIEVGNLTNWEMDTIFGGEGNDSISGGNAGQSLSGGAGNDTISGGDDAGTADADTIDGGDGDDYLVSGFVGAVAFVNGDSMLGGDGNDTIIGGNASDTIDAGGDNDSIEGGLGNDTIAGGAGDDYVDGGDGDDFLTTGTGQDTLIGGDGNDTLMNAAGDDSLVGGAGDDSIVATLGDDTLEGGDGDDTLIGGADNDSILGGAGSDLIYGGSGTFRSAEIGVGDNDTVTGSVGADTFVWTGATGETSEITFDDGAGTAFDGDGSDDHLYVSGSGDGSALVVNGFDVGTDRIFLSEEPTTVLQSLGVDSTTFTVIYASGNEQTFLINGASADSLDESVFEVAAAPSASDDYMDGGDDADTFFIENDFGNDTISGGEGGTDSDTIDLSNLSGAVTVTYTGGEAGTITDGINTITFSGIERIIGTDQADIIDATADSVGTSLDGGDGNDTITGGSGADTIIAQSGSGDNLISGGAGADLITGNDQSTVYGGTGNDTISMGYSASGNEAYGDAGNDSLIGTNGNQALYGGTGDDTIIGGNDFATSDRDTLDGGDGNDSIVSGANTTPTNASWQQNGDLMRGGAGNDTLVGGAANDTLSGGADDDSLDGGDGADTFIVEDGFGNDTIVGGEGTSPGPNDDVIDLSALSGPVTVTYTGDEAGTITDGTDTISFSEVERLILTDQADSLAGSADGAGLDVDAGGGDDTLQGGAAEDSLEGGTGDDLLTGGGSNDTFVYVPGDGSDTITDFNTGNSGTLSDGDSTNNDFIDLSTFYDTIFELHADQADDGELNQSNTTGPDAADYSDNAQFAPGEGLIFQGASADNSSFTSENTGVVCFTSGTAIRTPQGDVLIDDLRVGDLVTTMDNGAQRIEWIGTTEFGPSQLAGNPRLRPVLIQRGVFGAARDLLVSPQHGVLIDGDHLARATHLAKTTKGIRIANGKKNVTYIHIMFDAHQIIFAEDAPSESFYPGPMALKMMNKNARAEIQSLLPELVKMSSKEDLSCIYGATARSFIHKRDIKDILALAPKTVGFERTLKRVSSVGRAQKAQPHLSGPLILEHKKAPCFPGHMPLSRHHEAELYRQPV